ncbi:16S rRNA (uracil(1498)-N(3))-methyltransferase [Marinomonas mediterranea]|uniref:16S rRNA (uracil(1498)-N(3))-methyltransferase n=1 Tax=Marinomonas mediterranea TaxID=119864 RepID=UPI00234B1629|nr:16S rRNA (uracil(1498)-N(3))-methyltransferase [Marinomonas mediterranea]WCN11114.1 16S rRNA (uracil(1498)-N(3))-methyltransferase [Marinomonas mediterranea]
MRIPRIYVDIDLTEHTEIILPDSAFQHCCKVLRLKEGHAIILFNGDGGEYDATLYNVQKRAASAQLTTYRVLENESPLKVTIGQSLSRGERMDYAIQKAVESGVFRIQPLFSERCEVKLQEDRMEKRLKHWQQVAISATEQCGRGVVPKILEPINLLDWVEKCNEMLKITLHHHSAKPIHDFERPPENSIALLIGPEGGLTDIEVEKASLFGFQSIALGPRVLRTETAPVVALTTLNLMWGDL